MVEGSITDLAVIFSPYKNEDGELRYAPIEVVEGYYDEDDDKFIDIDLFSYAHLTCLEKGKGFAIRNSISELSLLYPDKSLDEIKEDLLKEHSKYDYFLGYYEDEVFLFSTDKETGENTFVLDQDIENYLMCMYEGEDIINLFMKNNTKQTEDNLMENKQNEEKDTNNNFDLNINPHLLYKQIREVVKGQDDAIKEIVTCVWENYMSDHANNMLLVGSSGTGKTEILRQLSKKLGIPLLITTVTGMSQAGYVGSGTDEILENLLNLTKGDVEKAEHAIVVLDEIDKIAFMGSSSGKVSTEGVQNELLKIVEDGTFYVKTNVNGLPSTQKINTANITFIGVGAFNGMLTTKVNKSIGFGNDITEREVNKDKIAPEDLVNYGLKPELVGRMGKIIKLNDLDLDIMKDIIKNSKASAYRSKIKFINDIGITISPENEEEIVEEIAKIALSRKTGARAINGIVTEMFSKVLFDISDPDEVYSKLEMSKEMVTDSKKYVLRK